MSAAPSGAALFVTCLVDQLFPQVGEAAVAVLRRAGVEVGFPRGQTCCGQVAFNDGFWPQARTMALRFLEAFEPWAAIVAPSASYHWHLEVMPALTQVAGFEWGSGFYINPVVPEEAARYLREVQTDAEAIFPLADGVRIHGEVGD